MFNQESYDKATVQVESQPGDLFNKYEIKSWEFSPFIYKVLAASAIVHIAFLAFITQTNVLTMRGCDNPWAGRVCQVVDMAYVGSVLFGTEREYADVAYERTELGPEDEITYIDVTGQEPQLTYPDGYFQIANPVQYQMLQQQATNGTDGMSLPGLNSGGFPPIPNRDSDLLKIRPNYPTANPNAFKDDSDSLYKVGDDQSNTGTISRRKGRGGKVEQPVNANSEQKKPEENVVANDNTNTQPVPPVNPNATPVDEAKPDQFGIYINKRPLKDKAKETVAQIESKNLKLDKSFKVIIEGTLGLGKDGKTTILKNPKPVPVDPKIPNDPEMVKLAQDWIVAVGDAGWYGYVNMLDDKTKAKPSKVVITVEQNDSDFVANIRSDKVSEETARKIASGLGGILQLAAAAAKNDEAVFLKAAAPPTSEGKTLILNFSFPKPVVQELIQRKLAESKETKTEPSSTALNAATANTASK